MDVTRDVVALRRKLSGTSPATVIRVKCLCKPEAELIQSALTPAERERVTFSWVMQNASYGPLQAHPLRSYVQN
ncbi:MAG TPA: hypothetical protein VFU47_17085 [Armatimonadota bacterium]|jgi:hypothetical protein|nr:hypothetical protein [Armatimonadota bacterium]